MNCVLLDFHFVNQLASKYEAECVGKEVRS